MRIAIVDDEKTERISLNKMLNHWAGINHVDITCDYFSAGNDFLSAMNQIRYDLVFMDIYMDETDGIQTAEKMRQTDQECCLVFLTSSQEHMPQAFPCHAFDYLLKPLVPERLFQTLSDFLCIFPEKQLYINLPLGRQVVPVLYSHLEYISADSNYCIVQAQEQYRCRMPFSRLKAILEEDERFCTINRGILVNLDLVLYSLLMPFVEYQFPLVHHNIFFTLTVPFCFIGYCMAVDLENIKLLYLTMWRTGKFYGIRFSHKQRNEKP